jgi:hypothetical protein
VDEDEQQQQPAQTSRNYPEPEPDQEQGQPEQPLSEEHINHRLDGIHGSAHTLDPDELSAELERQAREMLDALRATAGDLGERVRRAVNHATSLWDETHPGTPAEASVPPEDDRRARKLAGRWVAHDFLVDPDLPTAMTVRSVTAARIWHVALHERGERRELSEGTEPYTGQRPATPGPVLPVWDYVFPVTPEINSGVRRERLSGTGTVASCARCNGSGHRACAGCEGKGLVPCPRCHGRARVVCPRCRGRGHIADPDAERQARASRPYLQIQAERVAQDARDRLAGFAERLRQDYAIPLPPTSQWLPAAPASGVTIPCPDCTDGTIPCTCNEGKVVCETCKGTGYDLCPACSGTGRVVRHTQVVRHFDTHIHQHTLPYGDSAAASWVTHEMLRKVHAEDAWDGPTSAMVAGAPASVPADVWAAAIAFARTPGEPQESSPAAPGDRRVIARRLRLSRVPVTRVEYTFAGKPFSFIAVGREGHEKFWAQEFPPRWSRVERFLRALSRDLARDGGATSGAPATSERPSGLLSHIEDFRSRRLTSGDTGQDAD